MNMDDEKEQTARIITFLQKAAGFYQYQHSIPRSAIMIALVDWIVLEILQMPDEAVRKELVDAHCAFMQAALKIDLPSILKRQGG